MNVEILKAVGLGCLVVWAIIMLITMWEYRS